MIKFGTGGWRAVIADDFTKSNIRLLTAGLCSLMKKEGHDKAEICVGYDRRFLSKESAHWAAEVLCGYGFKVLMINRSSPTPLVMYTVKTHEMPYGMMITASHNPAVYNGIKIFTAGGRDADQTVTRKIEDEIAGIVTGKVKNKIIGIDAGKIEDQITGSDVGKIEDQITGSDAGKIEDQITGSDTGYIEDEITRNNAEKIPDISYDKALSLGMIREDNTANEYIDSILSLVDADAIRKARLKIALDPMYGVSQTSLRTILGTCRCDLEVIHDRHDTLFGGKLPAPNAKTLTTLSYVVTDRYCNLGIATDGDADRLGVIDEKGCFVHPNTLLVLLYYYLVRYRHWNGPCVRNNSTTHLLDRVAEGFGQQCYEVPVGFKYISAKMAESNAIIGGESSGGLAVRGHISGKDGIYAAALLTEMLAVTGKSLSVLYEEITSHFGELVYREADFSMTPEYKESLKAKLFEEKFVPALCNVDHISREDGVKLYFTDGSWVICRFSGTEPLLRMAAEACSAALADSYITAWKELLKL